MREYAPPCSRLSTKAQDILETRRNYIDAFPVACQGDLVHYLQQALGPDVASQVLSMHA